MDYINRMQLYAELPARLQIGREFRQARRIQQSLLSNLERKTLLWLAQRTPRYINSDHLTLLGLSAMLLAGAAFAYAHRNPHALWLVMVCLAVNWLGDSLDGTLARFRNQQRPRYGFYVDHIVDAIGTLALFAGMAYSGYMSVGVAAVLLIAYLLLSIEVYLATYTLGDFKLSFFAFSPTELRIVLAIGCWRLLRHPIAHIFFLGKSFQLFNLGGVIAAAGMVAIFLFSAVQNTRKLYQQEQLL